jgi:type II secretory pathway predicted ATPase ExeA
MQNKQLQALYGLKYNPFSPQLTPDALWEHSGMDVFWIKFQGLLDSGGFGLITGEPGMGKSKMLQWLAHRLEPRSELVVAVMERPQSGLADFYREMGERFAVALSVVNRYGGFKVLRERWRQHIKNVLYRPVLLIDEAQEVSTDCLNELRLLSSANFDSDCLLTTVLCGDNRLAERLRMRELIPLGSRIRARLTLKPLDRQDLLQYLNFMLDQSGGSQLMSDPLKLALCEHAAGNLRVLTNMGAELLAYAVERKLPKMTEDLYFEVLVPPETKSRRR